MKGWYRSQPEEGRCLVACRGIYSATSTVAPFGAWPSRKNTPGAVSQPPVELLTISGAVQKSHTSIYAIKEVKQGVV